MCFNCIGTSYNKTGFNTVQYGAKHKLGEKHDTYQYVPLVENLRWVLQSRDFFNVVYIKVKIISGSIYTDVCVMVH